MLTFIVRRLLIGIPLLLGMSFVTFMMIQLAPGDYFDSMRLDPQISEETIDRLERIYHFDRPAIVQYGYWLYNLCKLDLGESLSQKVSVIKIVNARLVNTLLLTTSSMLFTWMVAIPIGIFCAVRQYSLRDSFFSFVAFFGISVPNFFLALLLLYLFGSVLGVLPIGGLTSVGFAELSVWQKVLDVARHLLIPVIVVGTAPMAFYQRLMRGNMLEVLRTQYITTARAKGLPENRVIYRHALRNAINPMVTIFGYEISGLLSGAALTEIITSYPGLGSTMLSAVRSQDIFLVMGVMLMGGFLLILGNLIADILLGWLDPQIRLEGA